MTKPKTIKKKKEKKVRRTIVEYHTGAKIPQNAVYLNSVKRLYPEKVEYVTHYFLIYE